MEQYRDRCDHEHLPPGCLRCFGKSFATSAVRSGKGPYFFFNSASRSFIRR